MALLRLLFFLSFFCISSVFMLLSFSVFLLSSFCLFLSCFCLVCLSSVFLLSFLYFFCLSSVVCIFFIFSAFVIFSRSLSFFYWGTARPSGFSLGVVPFLCLCYVFCLVRFLSFFCHFLSFFLCCVSGVGTIYKIPSGMCSA